MPLNPDQLREGLIHALKAVQDNAGRKIPEIDDALVPIGGLTGFDSLSGVEAAIVLSQRVGKTIKFIPFFDRNGAPRSLRSIVEDLAAMENGARMAGRPGSGRAAA